MLKKRPPTIEGMTVIHEGTRIVGNIEVAGSIRIDGEVQGGINASGDVFIGKEGKVTGDITASNATVEGMLIGNLKVSEHAFFTASSSFRGELSYKTCEVEKGARLNSTMVSEMPEPGGEQKERGFLGKKRTGKGVGEETEASDSKTA